jgi:hypothetical protein
VGSFSIVPIGTYAASTNFHHLRDTTLVSAALTGTAFGTGVIVGLAVGGSTVACVYACREACRVEAEERPPRTLAGGEGRTAQASSPDEGLIRPLYRGSDHSPNSVGVAIVIRQRRCWSRHRTILVLALWRSKYALVGRFGCDDCRDRGVCVSRGLA